MIDGYKRCLVANTVQADRGSYDVSIMNEVRVTSTVTQETAASELQCSARRQKQHGRT
jgi:hypothetical protein